MEKVPNWYVLTGGPDSGKTTVIKYLSKKGYYTVPEYARLVINKELRKGKTLKEIRGNEVKFQDEVDRFKISLEQKTPRDEIVFFDRGLPDLLAYYKFLKLIPANNLLKLSKHKYNKVFLLDMLSYKKDYARTESRKEAKKLHRLIRQTYQNLGYTIVKIPVTSVERRAEMILNHVDKD